MILSDEVVWFWPQNPKNYTTSSLNITYITYTSHLNDIRIVKYNIRAFQRRAGRVPDAFQLRGRQSGFFFRYDYLGEISKWLINYSQRLQKFLTAIKNSHNFSIFGQIITRRRNLFSDLSCFYHEIKKSRFWLQWSISLEYVLVY